MAALGSCHMFSDQYLDKEENGKILVSEQVCVFHRVTKEFQLNSFLLAKKAVKAMWCESHHCYQLTSWRLCHSTTNRKEFVTVQRIACASGL